MEVYFKKIYCDISGGRLFFKNPLNIKRWKFIYISTAIWEVEVYFKKIHCDISGEGLFLKIPLLQHKAVLQEEEFLKNLLWYKQW